MREPEDFVRSREDLLSVHLTDSDIVDVLEALKEKAKLGNYECAKILFDLKYGKNPPPPNEGLSLADLMAAAPTGIVPGPDDI